MSVKKQWFLGGLVLLSLFPALTFADISLGGNGVRYYETDVSDEDAGYMDEYVDSVKRNRDRAMQERASERTATPAATPAPTPAPESPAAEQPRGSNQKKDNRQVSLFTFVLAETTGICVPCFGLAHFIMGDSDGGWFSLSLTGAGLLTWVAAEYGVENDVLTGHAYSAVHYASIALIAASYLYDVIGAPFYYADHSQGITIGPSIEVDSSYVAVVPEIRIPEIRIPEVRVKFCNLKIEF